MDHSTSVLAWAGALLLAGGGGSRLQSVTSGFAERSAASSWSRALRTTEQVGAPSSSASIGSAASSNSAALDNARGNAPTAAGQSGRFSLLTYNVAGLPELFSGSDPEVDIALISPLLNHYDIALVQEDFAYHSLLTSHAKHAYRSDTMHTSLALMPDGLNLFSRYSFGWMHRVRWTQCNGYLGAANDCLADKGFSFAEVTLAPGVTVDMYDLHAEAGRAPMDVDVRRANFAQLSEYMRVHSRQRAVVIAGDTNLKMSLPHDVETLSHFLEQNGLTDACRRLGCGDERIDRVFLRSSPELELAPLGWWTDRRFVDVHGEPLSDHSAVGVEVAWVQRSSADLVAGR